MLVDGIDQVFFWHEAFLAFDCREVEASSLQIAGARDVNFNNFMMEIMLSVPLALNTFSKDAYSSSVRSTHIVPHLNSEKLPTDTFHK
ncbi:hypothetical protein GCM10027343_19400 [Noviherbaspirillum agri]